MGLPAGTGMRHDGAIKPGGAMNSLGKVVAAAAVGSILMVVTGCNGDEVVIAGRDAAAVVAHENAVKIRNAGSFAARWKVSQNSLADVGKALTTSDVWTGVHDTLKSVNADTPGPVRDILMQTACDSVRQGRYDYDTVVKNLERNSADALQPVPQQRAGTVQTIADTLNASYNSNSAQARASVAIGCYIVNASFQSDG